jgi:signal transduction histidine kinase
VITHLTWNGGEPDPRVLQSSFALILLAALGFRVLGEGPVGLVSWPVAGVLLTTVGGLVLLTAPAARRTTLARLLAVVHIASLGMLAQGSELFVAAPLVVLPAIWLGLEMGKRGAALATAAVVAFITVPGMILTGFDVIAVERLLILAGLAGFGGLASNGALTKSLAAQARAEAREAELAEALDVIERNRRSAQAIFEAVDVGLALLDRDGMPTLINEPLAHFSQLAYPDGDVSRGWVFDESGRNRIPIEEVPTARARKGEEFDDVRVWVGEEEGSRRAMSVSARRVEDVDGRLAGAAISYTDVTDFMRALQVKDDFIALISHELRTPLTPIIGYVAMALERPELDPLLRKHLEVVARSGQRLERLVDDLLEEVDHASRPMPLKKQPTDLAAIIRDSVAAAEPEAVRVGVTLDAEVPAELAFTGDPQRLGQVVDHLVSNALKYTESGGTAQVSAAADSGAVVIRVRDSGIGISPEEQPQLFTRFFRTSEATHRAIQGIGLGLSISKTIVEGHGGLIELESEPGRGSEFRVVLPLPLDSLAS